jgi:hypothetical protein
MGPVSSFVVEGPLRPAPLPRGAKAYPAPKNRLVAYLALSAVAPVQSTDPTRPGVPLWYYNVSAHDKGMENGLARQGLTEAQILERSVLFSLLGPDAVVLGQSAEQKALELGWLPSWRNPPTAPDPNGTGWRPRAEALRRPRPTQPVPLDVVIQHLMTIRTKLFTGEVPGWLLAWDDRGNPHQPCGLVYGMRGLAVGEPCGRATGCVIAGGGACAWARQALTDGAKARRPRKVVATEHLIEPIAPAYVSAPPVHLRGLVGQSAPPPHYPRPSLPAPHPYGEAQRQAQVAAAQRPLEWRPMGPGAAIGASPTNGSSGVSWPAAPPTRAAAPTFPQTPSAAPAPPVAAAPTPPPVVPDPAFEPANPPLVAEAPPLTWET